MVNFFIAGVQKGGTTALHSILTGHPQISMPREKELHFFDNEERDWSKRDYSGLERYFPDGRGRLKGEATPIYMYWPNSLERLHRYNSNAQLIMLLRHPSFRAYSHWRMQTARGLEELSFEQAIGPQGRARVAESPGGVHRLFSYVERGFYSSQVERVYSLFPRTQVLFLRTDSLWLHPAETIARIEDFLHVDRALKPRGDYVTPVRSERGGNLPNDIRALLDDIFAEDIRKTSGLTGLQLEDWLRPEYKESMGPR